MTLTPVELRHVKFGRGVFGYRRSAVDRAVDEVRASFEEVWRERADLADRIEQLEHELVRYRELEALLRGTLVSAERAAHELRDNAKREAELILSEAHAESRAITRAAAADRERLLADSLRIRGLLRTALEVLSEAPEGAKTRPEAA